MIAETSEASEELRLEDLISEDAEPFADIFATLHFELSDILNAIEHIDEEYAGIVTGVMSFGMFVELPNKIEGLVRIDDLKDDYYTYDESTFSLIGNKNKRGYRLGDEVKVIVKAASKINHTIDFLIKR